MIDEPAKATNITLPTLPLTPPLLARIRMMDVIKKEVVLPTSLTQLPVSLAQFPMVSASSPARTKSSPVRTSPPRRNSMALPDTVNPASRVGFKGWILVLDVTSWVVLQTCN